MPSFYERLAELKRANATFAVATVVGRRSPVSSHLGDRALVFPDGRMDGFVGGSCSRDIVRRHALAAMRNGRPVVLQIRPDAGADVDPAANAERVIVPMGCASEGAVDVYVEPHVSQRRLIVAGHTPVAESVARIAMALDYDVTRVVASDELRDAPDIEDTRTIELDALAKELEGLDDDARRSVVAVVASQGHYDEAVLETLLAHEVAFVGLLASRRRAATVLGVLCQAGVAPEKLATIHHPVGLDIGARTPGEVAISILAQIVSSAPSRAYDAPLPAVAAVAIDPVCGMDVELASARHRFEHRGVAYAFCCAGCRSSFAADPERYIHAQPTA